MNFWIHVSINIQRSRKVKFLILYEFLAELGCDNMTAILIVFELNKII